jgi:hypothetical protein
VGEGGLSLSAAFSKDLIFFFRILGGGFSLRPAYDIVLKSDFFYNHRFTT